MLRANCSVIVRSRPPAPHLPGLSAAEHAAVVADRDLPGIGAPEHDLGALARRTPARSSSGASGVPAQRAFPIAADEERQAGVARALQREGRPHDAGAPSGRPASSDCGSATRPPMRRR